MKVKLDENLPVGASQVLTEIGHDVETVIGEGLAGRDDPTVLAAASSEARVLVTLDRGFGDVRAYPPGSQGGIIVLPPDSQAPSSVLGLSPNRVLTIADLQGVTSDFDRHLDRVIQRDRPDTLTVDQDIKRPTTDLHTDCFSCHVQRCRHLGVPPDELGVSPLGQGERFNSAYR